MMRLSDYVVERLQCHGVSHVFLVTGRGMLYLSDAVARNKNVTGISTHHEQAAAYAAMAYAENNCSIGVCMVSTGCAATNAITGVLCAWQDGIPVVFISGQNMLHETTRFTGIPLRTYGQQETDIVSIVEPITKYAVMIEHPDSIGYELDKALYLANSGRKGPVWIDIPLDIQNARIDPESLNHYIPEKDVLSSPSKEDIEYVVTAFSQAKRPAIIIGSGIQSANAIDIFSDFVTKFQIPVTYAPSASDTYSTSNPLSIGAVGSMGGTRAGNFTIQNSDLLLVLGHRLSSMTTSPEYQKFARDATVIVVDIDEIEHSKKSVDIHRLIISDVKIFLEELMIVGINPSSAEWRNRCLHWKSIFPKCEDSFRRSETVDLYHFTESLSSFLPDEATLLTDAGLEELIVPTNISLRKGQRCIHPVAQGAMGFALPASIGAYFARNTLVSAVIGDGSIMMNLQELQTIVYHNIPAKLFVINNNGYSIIRRRQQSLFRERTIGNDSSDGVGLPNFSKIAECFNIKYLLINHPSNLEVKLKEVFSFEGPVLCEVLSPEDQDYIHSSYARTSTKRFVNRPLEDQKPYLDRDVFLSEMIIEPIDQ